MASKDIAICNGVFYESVEKMMAEEEFQLCDVRRDCERFKEFIERKRIGGNSVSLYCGCINKEMKI